jgi:capsid protein
MGFNLLEMFGFVTEPEANNLAEPKSFVEGNSQQITSGNTLVRSYSFNGEKNPGELGNPINLIADPSALRHRAYEYELTSDAVKIITGKFFKWVVGSGLKLQAEPNEKVLTLEKVSEDLTEFQSNVEAYFSLYADSLLPDFSGMTNLHDLALNAYKTAFLGGDCLAVARFDDDYNITIQIIDGQHIATPLLSNYITEADARGNKIRHGIEIDKNGKHVAFYVIKDGAGALSEFERIEAKGEKTGCLMAWMIYGSKQRIDHLRGISQLTPILEKIAKLDRYTEATVSSAEERAKLPWYIKHSRFSDGENPMLGNIKRNAGGTVTESSFNLGVGVAKEITATENKTVYNMPVDSELKALDSNAEVTYDTFFTAVFNQLCAALDIPPEVALQKYSSNYSASRAAINGWEYIIKIHREKFAKEFYQKFYNLWLYVHVLKNKVQANGYLTAVNGKNSYITNAYSKARFLGVNMPHIDPVKEAKAVRTMLGDIKAGEAPLITHEQATEQLGNGEFSENVKKFKTELDLVKPLIPVENAVNSEN